MPGRIRLNNSLSLSALKPELWHAEMISRSSASTLAIASGILSLAFGCLVVYQIGFVNGLFTGNPVWTPK